MKIVYQHGYSPDENLELIRIEHELDCFILHIDDGTTRWATDIVIEGEYVYAICPENF